MYIETASLPIIRAFSAHLYLFINELRIRTQLLFPFVANLGDPVSLGDQQIPGQNRSDFIG